MARMSGQMTDVILLVDIAIYVGPGWFGDGIRTVVGSVSNPLIPLVFKTRLIRVIRVKSKMKKL